MERELRIVYACTDLMLFLRNASDSQFVFFFFSSRRRHTRLQGDWSSDVCSSDLYELLQIDLTRPPRQTDVIVVKQALLSMFGMAAPVDERALFLREPVDLRGKEIGRASCRERV